MTDSIAAYTGRQAITTKFLGPTNYRGARFKASAQAGSATVPQDYSVGAMDNHAAACEALALKNGWYHGDGGSWPPGRWVGGATPKGDGACFVWVPDNA